MNQDLENLRLLSIFHYILGGLFMLCGCFPVIHLTVGIGLITESQRAGPGNQPPPAFVGMIFVIVALFFIGLMWTLAICMMFAAKFLTEQRRYMFCLVVACVMCLQTPLGTILGVFTIVVLQRQSVKDLFKAQETGGFIDRPPFPGSRRRY